MALPERRGGAGSPARPGGAALRGGLRARGVPPLLGRAVVERRGAGPRRGAALAARRAHTRARLRPGAAQHRRGACRRARARHGLVGRRRGRGGGATPAATARRSRRWSAIGRRRRRFWPARRSSWCWPPTCSTSNATSTSSSTCCRASWASAGASSWPIPGGPPPSASWRVRAHDFEVTTIMSTRFPRVAIHRLRGRSASAR